jgi:hypothetical protein
MKDNALHDTQRKSPVVKSTKSPFAVEKNNLHLVLSLTPIALLGDWPASPPLLDRHPLMAHKHESTVEVVLDVQP